MQKVTLVARYLLALMMLVFGLNKFIGFMPMPELSGFAAEFMGVVGGSYLLKTIALVEIAGGILLALNKAVGLATVLLAPVAFNAFMFHLTLDPGGIAAAAIFVVLLVLVIVGHTDRYKALLA